MRTKKTYTGVSRHRFRSEIVTCATCATRLRRHSTLSERTIITLQGPLQVTHCSYRCPNRECATPSRSYRSAAADALALPGFTFGLDVIVWIGHLRLAQHQTLDQTHQALQQRLAPFHLTISRREVLYLFEAYCTLLRSSQQLAGDLLWQEQVRANGGLILSLDGIQPDKGNETVYLVRDILTGRLLVAENVRSSRTEFIQELLAPVVALKLPVVAVISDAQESIIQAIGAVWPQVPHQVCQFHYLREASRPMYEMDRSVRTQMRQAIQQPVREVRHQMRRLLSDSIPLAAERDQLAVLDDYALGIQTALHLDGQQPFRYASLAADEALTELATSLQTLEKRGQLAAATSPLNCSGYRIWWRAASSGVRH